MFSLDGQKFRLHFWGTYKEFALIIGLAIKYLFYFFFLYPFHRDTLLAELLFQIQIIYNF